MLPPLSTYWNPIATIDLSCHIIIVVHVLLNTQLPIQILIRNKILPYSPKPHIRELIYINTFHSPPCLWFQIGYAFMTSSQIVECNRLYISPVNPYYIARYYACTQYLSINNLKDIVILNCSISLFTQLC
jgi:hypothetical protein